ncbi:PAS domain S-box protein [Mangrovitalea sediminis]|uniref:PAS domain S-box protein n=1 Tax=Mangrovitalea sediminis TaxID=1982043 RepID=UPI0018EA0FF5|nr:PAS domain S-box protein [Mangrovitalea sediminis]
MLLENDPQPAAILDAEARLVRHNGALRALQDIDGTAVWHWLPYNLAALVSASLRQRRAIEEVEHEVGGRILLWTFVPDLESGQVLARGRDATQERKAVRKAAEASRLYRLITENTTDLISHHAQDGTFLDASPAAWTLLGYWPEELRGIRIKQLLHEDDLNQLYRAREELELAGRYTMTYRIRHRHGHYVWFETACHAIRDAYSGEVDEVVSVSRDVSARIRAEEIRHRLADVIEATTDLVLFLDAEGRLTYFNRAARDALMGTPEQQDQTVGQDAPLPTLESLFTEACRQTLLDGLDAARANGVWKAEMVWNPDRRPQLPVSLVLLAHTTAEGGRYFSVVARDMTERELRESQMRHHQEELAHASRLTTLGELASGIAHEMNQPLAAVVNYAGASLRYLSRLPEKGPDVDKIAEGLNRITLHANHASEVIKRLRAFLRKGQQRLQRLDVNQVIEHAVRLCQWDAAEKQVQIRPRLAGDLPDIYVDPVLLEQVLINLLRNAIEANHECHDKTSDVFIDSLRNEQGWVEVRITDQGPGFVGDSPEQLFTPFYTSKSEGLGLGLSISRTLAEGFGGHLEAIPAEGGLMFRCRLPALDYGNDERTAADRSSPSPLTDSRISRNRS